MVELRYSYMKTDTKIDCSLKNVELFQEGSKTWIPTDVERLQEFGAFIKVYILPKVGDRPVVSGDALIDPGSSITWIDGSIADQFSLPRRPFERGVVSASHPDASAEATQFAVAFPDFDFYFELPVALINPHLLETTGALVLMGRDVLSHFKFEYNGPSGSASLTLLPTNARSSDGL